MSYVVIRFSAVPHGDQNAVARFLASKGINIDIADADHDPERINAGGDGIECQYEGGNIIPWNIAAALRQLAPGSTFRITSLCDAGEDMGESAIAHSVYAYAPGLGMFSAGDDLDSDGFPDADKLTGAAREAAVSGPGDNVISGIAGRLAGTQWKERLAAAAAETLAAQQAGALHLCVPCHAAVSGDAEPPDRPAESENGGRSCQWCGGPGPLRPARTEDAERILPVTVAGPDEDSTACTLAWPGAVSPAYESPARAWEAWRAGDALPETARHEALRRMADLRDSASCTVIAAEFEPGTCIVRADIPGHDPLLLNATHGPDRTVTAVRDSRTEAPVTGALRGTAAAAVRAYLEDKNYRSHLKDVREAAERMEDRGPGSVRALLIHGTGTPWDRNSTWVIQHSANPASPVTATMSHFDMTEIFRPDTVTIAPMSSAGPRRAIARPRTGTTGPGPSHTI